MVSKPEMLWRKQVRTAVYLAVLLVATLILSRPGAGQHGYVAQIPDDIQPKSCNLCHTTPPVLNAQGQQWAASRDFSVFRPVAAPAPAAPSTPAVRALAPRQAAARIQLDVSGQPVTALQEGDVILVPLREFAQATGWQVGYDPAEHASFLRTRTGSVVRFYLADGRAVTATEDIPAGVRLLEGRTHVPLDILRRVLHLRVDTAARPVSVEKSIKTIQWEGSPHATLVEGPSTRDTCIACHTGQGFAQGITRMADMPGPPEPITCGACHTQIPRLRRTGTIKLPTGLSVDGGKGSVCMNCHNSRRDPKEPGRFAPHNGPQTDMLVGSGGAEVPGERYDASPHVAIADTCVTCHMAPTPPAGSPGHNQVGEHTYRTSLGDVKNTAACSLCHRDLNTFNRRARGDFDGDERVAGIQDEVKGLLTLVSEQLARQTGGATFVSRAGRIVFVWPDGSEVSQDLISDAAYRAAYNIEFIKKDGSYGVHNPVYAVQLLQKSYRELTGRDVPQARIR